MPVGNLSDRPGKRLDHRAPVRQFDTRLLVVNADPVKSSSSTGADERLFRTKTPCCCHCIWIGRTMGNHGSNLDDILAEDMHHWYNKFMRDSPSGLITLFELKTILGLKGMTENANSYVDQVFFTFDMDGDGYIDFVEYIAAISLMLKGEINQKLKWYFKLFDQDGNGKIDKEELETIFSAIQDITRNRDIDPEEIVTLIFERIDVKGEGELTLEEFIEGAKDHEDIMDMLKNLMDLTPVLMIIVEGIRP
ncbi:guanylyl cyclase-activating protein 1-like isoform X2 [Syngnathus typhle]|uniref:guanylyl cyclase-activating protein 1-like isoform X2 n=1 Tax=Syngnathus typhle TaxID=161592 RepID=UPI002A698D9B|nr:guanylyl cyclase-activating protein 1-like isoform X2 [Syngnathus typhle]